MILSDTNYRRITVAFGTLFLLYGGGAIFNYFYFVVTGENSLEAFTNSFGVLFLGLMGTFGLPLAIALFVAKQEARVLLIIASVVLFLNGLFRLSVLAVPDMVDVAGVSTPVIEFFIFGLLGSIALFFRPNLRSQD